MKKKGHISRSAIIAIAACFLASVSAFGQTADGPDFNAPVTLNLKDAKVSDVFRLLAMQYDLNIVLSPSISGTVSLRLSNVTLREALSVIIEAADARIVYNNSIMHVYSRSEKELKDVSAGEMITEILPVNYVDPGSLMTVLRDYQSKTGSMKLFKRKNVSSSGTEKANPILIITDYPQHMDAMRKMYDKLDTETPQVLIETKIVETNLSDAEIMGTDWNLKASLSGSPVQFDTRYGGQIKYGSLKTSEFGAVYERVMKDTTSNVLSNARLSVLDGESAHIHVGDLIPVGLNTIGSGTGGNANFGTTDIQQWEVGVTIDVTPVVLNDDLIRMHVRPDVSSVQEFTAIGDGKAPITAARSVDTRILIRSGETIIIGGLIQNEEGKLEKKVPVLGDLPLVGSMFRKKENTNRKVNLLIFITGTVMEKKGNVSKKLPAISESEYPGSSVETTVALPESVVAPEKAEEQPIDMESFLEYK